MSALSDLKTGISLTSLKGDVRQPQNYAMGRIPEGYSRWMTASQYHTDVERILQELKSAVSFVSSSPDQDFLLKHSLNLEDYVMYHQGYFLDLVHQLKDKVCQLINAVITPEKNYSKKHEKAVELKKLINNTHALKVPSLVDYLKEWDDASHSGPIAIVLKKRTFYHHFKNPLPDTESYFKVKTNRFLLSPSFQIHLSDYGKQIVAEKEREGLQAWQEDTVVKMTTTFEAIENNIENIARALISYYRLPYNSELGKRVIQQYVALDGTLEVPDSSYQIESIGQPIRGMLEALAGILPSTFGEEFLALYVTGSIPRGDFMWGLSDVNFVVVVKDDNKQEFKENVRHFIDNPVLALRMPIDTQVLFESEFMSPEESKLRFICRTDGLQLMGKNLLSKEKEQRICFKLAWLLNQDFEDFLCSLKEKLNDQSQSFAQHKLTILARELGKRVYRLAFSQVIGNNIRYSSSFKEMRRLNNLYYPGNSMFNDQVYELFTAHPIVTRDDLIDVCNSFEEKLMPLYSAVDGVVNGVSKKVVDYRE